MWKLILRIVIRINFLKISRWIIRMTLLINLLKT